jgi:hypothetical protein
VYGNELTRGRPLTFAFGAPPASFRLVGNLPPSDRETALSVNSVSTWESFPKKLLAQWRWDHDREGFLAEAEANAAARKADAERRRRAELSALTYDRFLKRRLFANWLESEYPPRKLVLASRKILLDSARRLKEMGPHARRTSKRKVLRECIEAFNALDEANDHFIETEEREAICEQFYALATLAGLSDEPELADEWREW